MIPWIKIEEQKTELEGPYECQGCGGHIMLDFSYLEQVSGFIRCPYCGLTGEIPDE